MGWCDQLWAPDTVSITAPTQKRRALINNSNIVGLFMDLREGPVKRAAQERTWRQKIIVMEADRKKSTRMELAVGY